MGRPKIPKFGSLAIFWNSDPFSDPFLTQFPVERTAIRSSQMSSRQQVYAGFTRFRNEMWIAFSAPQHQSFGGHAIRWQLLDENLRSKPNLHGYPRDYRFDYSDQLKDVVDLRNKLVASGIPFPERRNDEGTYDGAMLAEGSVGSIRKRLVKVVNGQCELKVVSNN